MPRVRTFLKKLDADLPCDSVIALLGIYPKDSISYYKDTYSSIFGVGRPTPIWKIHANMELNRATLKLSHTLWWQPT